MAIALHDVSKVFPNGQAALRDVTMEIADGELLAVVGPSGCGKTTLLRLIAGLETPTKGTISVDGQDVTGRPPQERDLAMVFQSYALYPHKSVRENLAFGLRMRGVDPAAMARRVDEVARALQIEPLLDRKPAQLSGGQRQRVALGRAIVREPRAFLLDEPLSNLDPTLRFETRAEIAELHRRLRATMIYVTHDQEEALTLGDRIAVMRDGVVEQMAAPLEIYRQPANTFVATFFGSPAMNLLSLPMTGPGLLLGVRPRDMRVVPRDQGDAVALIDLVESLGDDQIVRGRIEGPVSQAITVLVGSDERIEPGQAAGLCFRRDRLHFFDKPSGRRVVHELPAK